MQTSHFQLSLIALLSTALGVSISSSDAVGYPAPAISMGSNPIWNAGGTPPSSGYKTFYAPADQDLVITDIHFGALNSSWMKLQFEVSDVMVAAYAWTDTGDRYPISLENGIRVPAGSHVNVYFHHHYGVVNTQYTFSGYYAKP